jgi:hypothetical protein
MAGVHRAIDFEYNIGTKIGAKRHELEKMDLPFNS